MQHLADLLKQLDKLTSHAHNQLRSGELKDARAEQAAYARLVRQLRGLVLKHHTTSLDLTRRHYETLLFQLIEENPEIDWERVLFSDS